MEELQGIVDKITFHNPENGFTVFKVNHKKNAEPLTVVGVCPPLKTGEYVKLNGSYQHHQSFGKQFQAQKIEIALPNSQAGIEKYLASGIFPGIGPSFAKRMVTTLGDDIIDILDNNPEALKQVDGIGSKRYQQIVEGWQQNKQIRELMLFLEQHGIGSTRAVKIFKRYGTDAITKINNNPYKLALDIQGIGFKIADDIAMKLGVSQDSPLRINAGIHHVINDAITSGNCAVTKEKFLLKAQELLQITPDLIMNELQHEIAQDKIITVVIREQECFFSKKLFLAEQSVERNLNRILTAHSDFELEVVAEENNDDIKLSASQQQAVDVAISNKVTIITGGPGVGKTTVVNSILNILSSNDLQIALCAPTGRAAKRLSEATSMVATTIHRLLEYDPAIGGFKFNSTMQLPIDVLIVDEVSMIDLLLMQSLLQALPDEVKLILVGDVDQLPSVGPGMVLADLINSKAIATVKLTEIFRQAQHSQIITNAHLINSGNMPQANVENSDFYFISAKNPQQVQQKLLEVVKNRIPQRFGLDAKTQIQVLTPMNKSVLGTVNLNNLLRDALNGEANTSIKRFDMEYKIGDKIIQTSNNYEKEVFNGDIGFIIDIDNDNSKVTIDFDGRKVDYEAKDLDEINLAYAITIHKSQGSEYPAVVIPIAPQHQRMLERNLLYTAVTRGRELVVIIGDENSLRHACSYKRANLRLTNLENLLRYPQANLDKS